MSEVDNETETFAPLRIARRCLQGDISESSYRVYKTPAEFVTVRAMTALEAFRESGVAKPYKIERETRFKDRLFDQSKFADSMEIYETGRVIMDAPRQISSHSEAVPQLASPLSPAEEPATPPLPEQASSQPASEAEESELSAADIDALLGGMSDSAKGDEY